MVNCAQCGKAISGGHRYCMNCGAARPDGAERRCFFCDSAVAQGQLYCAGCGRPQTAVHREYKDPLENAVEKIKGSGNAVRDFSREQLLKGQAVLQKGGEAVKTTGEKVAAVKIKPNPVKRLKQKITRGFILVLLALVAVLGLALYILIRFRHLI